MKTDWALIREAMNTVVDSCERLERNGYTERHRDLQVDVHGHPVSIHEFMISAWTLPENVRYDILRRRHDQAADQAYVPEASRMLTAMAAACAELVGAAGVPSLDEPIHRMLRWYRKHFDPYVEQAIRAGIPGNNRRLSMGDRTFSTSAFQANR